jgi:hypothetical protein
MLKVLREVAIYNLKQKRRVGFLKLYLYILQISPDSLFMGFPYNNFFFQDSIIPSFLML